MYPSPLCHPLTQSLGGGENVTKKKGPLVCSGLSEVCHGKNLSRRAAKRAGILRLAHSSAPPAGGGLGWELAQASAGGERSMCKAGAQPRSPLAPGLLLRTEDRAGAPESCTPRWAPIRQGSGKRC